MITITAETVRYLLSVVDAGLVEGLGLPVPGQMCVEADPLPPSVAGLTKTARFFENLACEKILVELAKGWEQFQGPDAMSHGAMTALEDAVGKIRARRDALPWIAAAPPPEPDDQEDGA